MDLDDDELKATKILNGIIETSDFEFIQEFRKMKSIGDFCKITGINHSNLVKGTSSKENEKLIATLCKFEIIRLYHMIKESEIETKMKEVVENGKTNSL